MTIKPVTAPIVAPPTQPVVPAAPKPTAAQVKKAEKQLKLAGFSSGALDGKVSPTFTKSLKAFQTAWGLPANGQLDKATTAKLDATQKRIKGHKAKDLYISVGQRSGSIKTIESRLKKLGYDVGKADGIYSRQTAEAVRAFRHDQKELKDGSGALTRGSRSLLFKEVKKLSHAPERRRVSNTSKQRSADARTATAAKKGIVRSGTKKGVVANLQRHLKAAGFDPKRTSGVFDERTEAMVKQFQAKSKLPATGRVDAKTWSALKKSFITSTKTAQSLNERSGLVKGSEKLLKKLGYNPGKIDGLFTRQTVKATRAFEKKHHLTQDGKITAGELAKIKKVLKAKQGGKVTVNMRRLASNAKKVAMSMGGYNSQGLCATGVSRAIQKTYGIKVWGNGNQIDDNLPRNKFKQVHISLAKALKMPGVILTWEHTSTVLGNKYGHTAITLGDGHSSASDFIEGNTIAGNRSRRGLKIFMPIK